MNEEETRTELIDPKFKSFGWGVTEGSKILREYHRTADWLMATITLDVTAFIYRFLQHVLPCGFCSHR